VITAKWYVWVILGILARAAVDWIKSRYKRHKQSRCLPSKDGNVDLSQEIDKIYKLERLEIDK
jgi:hypothetical protein